MASPMTGPTAEAIRRERRQPASSTSTDYSLSTEMSVLTSTSSAPLLPAIGRDSHDSEISSSQHSSHDRLEDDDDREHEDEDAPLIAPSPSPSPLAEELSKWAVASLLLQHLSSTFIDGAYNFACFLFLIEIFSDSLVPASLVGLGTKLTGLVLSGSVGGLVDRHPRLWFIRRAIAAQKFLQAVNYGLFFILFGPLYSTANEAFHGRASTRDIVIIWTLLLSTVASSAAIDLANTGITVAVERDWVMTIAQRPDQLTELNTYMRRIDLISKLVAPMFVSLLTLWGYESAVATLLCLSLLTLASEQLWIGHVYKAFPALARPPEGGEREAEPTNWSLWLKREVRDWKEFASLPVFGSSVAIATIYLTTLSYDGTFIAYLKAARGWDDGFVALMRGVCVLTGLFGTIVMPLLERRLGLERAGAWSLWFEAVCLAPTLFAFFLPPPYGTHGPAWNSAVLFGGVALSRIGLWSFDLCQLKILQVALDSHPRRNRLTALQIALQNVFDLAKYAVTLAAATPRQFKWTALVSYVAVIAGAVAYMFFLRAVRGHLFHLNKIKIW